MMSSLSMPNPRLENVVKANLERTKIMEEKKKLQVQSQLESRPDSRMLRVEEFEEL